MRTWHERKAARNLKRNACLVTQLDRPCRFVAWTASLETKNRFCTQRTARSDAAGSQIEAAPGVTDRETRLEYAWYGGVSPYQQALPSQWQGVSVSLVVGDQLLPKNTFQ